MAPSAIPSTARRDARRDGADAVKDVARAAPVQREFERLATLVEALLVRFAALRAEHAAYGKELDIRAERIAALEGEVQRMQDSRSDVAVRIDELIAQIEQLEGRLVAQAEIP